MPNYRYLKLLRDFRRARSEQKHELKTCFYNPKQFFNYLSEFNQKSKLNGIEYEPIFIFSAGWRSGSTMLQRLLCSKSEILLWGEPYDKSSLIQKLADSLLPISKAWPPHSYFIENIKVKEIPNIWVANLYPNIEDMLAAHREFIINLFYKSAKSHAGAQMWGIKEVRFGLKEALYLKLLFPNSKFIFISRELVPAYTSYVGFSSLNWYSEWPHRTAFTAFSFARHRSRLLAEFAVASEVVGGYVLKYEDIVSGDVDINDLQEYSQVKIDQSVLNAKVGSGIQAKGCRRITILERVLLKCGNAYTRIFHDKYI